MNLFKEKKLILASHNQGKLTELREFLSPHKIEVVSSKELGLIEPEENGSSFAENASIKAVAALKATNLPALADDSGLCVNALHGNPGIYSARWAGVDKDFKIAMSRVNEELEKTGNQDRSAYFICVLALAIPDSLDIKIFEGRIYGRLIWPPRGEKGFGFDPMFVPDGYDKTFGELDHIVKQKISHRSNAFKKMIEECFAK